MLKASADYKRIAKQGRRWNAPAFIMQSVRMEGDAPFRLGLTASRKVGNAVTRNRARRRLREMVRTLGAALPAGVEVVLIAKTAAADYDFARLKEDFLKGLEATGVA